MLRVVGTDPGTSSLDLLLLVDGAVSDQVRFPAGTPPDSLAATLRQWSPINLIAGPSGYGLPLIRSETLTERDLDLMALVRPDERGSEVGVVGFRAWVRAFLATGQPTVFLPGGIHLATIPPHRKANAIDLGTPDKVAVLALALHGHGRATGELPAMATFAVVEVGSAFSAVLVVERGRLVDVAAGTRGPIGLLSGGSWDGEAAYWLAPLSKADLFRGGLADLGPTGPAAFRESLRKHVAALREVTPFDRLYLSGAGADRPEIAALVTSALAPRVDVHPLPTLPGAWVKHAAQGSALLADGLAGGQEGEALVDALDLRGASGTALDFLRVRSDPSRVE